MFLVLAIMQGFYFYFYFQSSQFAGIDKGIHASTGIPYICEHTIRYSVNKCY